LMPRKAAAFIFTLFERLKAMLISDLSTICRISSYRVLLDLWPVPRKRVRSSRVFSRAPSTVIDDSAFSNVLPFITTLGPFR